MSNLADRIRNLRKTLGLTQEELADKLGVKGRQTVSSWESGNNYPETAKLVQLAEIGKVSLDWLLTGKESNYKPPIKDYNDLKGDENVKYTAHPIPVIAKVVAGDIGLFTEDNIIRYEYFQRNMENCFLLEVYNDSMEPKIKAGDLVLADVKNTPISGDIVVLATADGRNLIKQYYLRDTMIELRSFNDNYPPFYLKPEEIAVIYRVIKIYPKPINV